MNILMLNPDMRPVCGRTSMVLHLARALHGHGHTVALMTGRDSDDAVLEGLPFPVLRTAMDPGRKSPGAVLELRRALNHAVRELRPDIVHTHHRYPAYVSGRWTDLRGAGHATTVHSFLKGRRRFRIHADAWVAVSDAVRSWMKDRFRMGAVPINVIRNGAPEQPHRTDLEEHFKQNGLSVLAAGRFAPEKGFDFLLKAWRDIAAVSGSNARLVIAGSGAAEGQLRALAAGMERSVTVMNGAGKMDELYAQANLVAVPSVMEPLSYIVLEAGMRGIPLIVTDSGGPSELVTHGRTGLVCEPESVRALHDALRSAMEHYDDMTGYAQKLRTGLLERNSINAMTDAYIRIYEYIAGRKADAQFEDRN